MLSSEFTAPCWIDQPDPFAAMLTCLSQYSILGVDTESNSLHAYQEQVCLIQFSTPEVDYLVDPLAISDIHGMGEIFANPKIEKIFHAAEYDVLCLKRDFGFQFVNLFDTMIAGRVLGKNAVGLASMLEKEFGIVLDKHFQRADWGLRPLTDPMKAYARLDTHYLFMLRDCMEKQLKDMGRWELACEDFNRVCEVHNGHPNSTLQDSFWRMHGIQDLTPRQLTILKALFDFRDLLAQQTNLPYFRILSNQVLIEIAQTHPRYIQELRLLPSISDLQIRRYGKGLIEAVKHGCEDPLIHRPSLQRIEDSLANRMEMLQSWRKKTGLQMGLESDVILPKDVLHVIAEANPKCLADLQASMKSVPWRYEHYGREILRALGH